MAEHDADKKRREAEDRAAHGQSLALGDTGGNSDTGVPDGRQGISNRPGDEGDEPYTQAGAPPRQDQNHTSLDTTSPSGRARDEGPDAVTLTGAQRPRRDPDATTPSDANPDDRETL